MAGKKKHSAASSHYRTLESSGRTRVHPVWATRSIVEITTIEVEGWVTAMARRGHGTTTVRRAHAVLSGILSDAVKSHRLAVNPVRGVENLPRRVARRHRYLNASEVHALAVEAGEHRVLVLLLAFCGLRWGEAIALRVGDVEFLRHRILVSTNALQLGGGHQIGPTKERRSRTVPIPQFVLEELSRLCVGKARDALIFPGQSVPHDFQLICMKILMRVRQFAESPHHLLQIHINPGPVVLDLITGTAEIGHIGSMNRDWAGRASRRPYARGLQGHR